MRTMEEHVNDTKDALLPIFWPSVSWEAAMPLRHKRRTPDQGSRFRRQNWWKESGAKGLPKKCMEISQQ
jgi:hypothetical protein